MCAGGGKVVAFHLLGKKSTQVRYPYLLNWEDRTTWRLGSGFSAWQMLKQDEPE